MVAVSREKYGPEVFSNNTENEFVEKRLLILISGGGGDFSVALNVCIKIINLKRSYIEIKHPIISGYLLGYPNKRGIKI